MKTRIISIMALLLTVAQGTWAQGELTKTGDKEWTLAAMPAYNIILQAEYYTDLLETSDNSSWITTNNGKTASIWLGRTLQAGSYNTFSVPFSMAIPSGWTVKKLTASEFNSSTGTLSLTFADETTGIEAGKPYLVKVSANVVNPTFDDVTVSSATTPTTTTAVNFVPTLGKALVTGDGTNASDPKTVLFLGAENKLYNPTVVNDSEQEASYMKGFRAYFQLTGEAALAPTLARAFVMNFGDGEQTTGIITVSADQPAAVHDGIYDLQGRRIEGQPTQKGMYIVNGKKTVIK